MSEVGDTAETIFCSNCKRDILQTNYVIHELHCQRFIYLCSKCNEPVNRKQKDEHENAKHVVVHCKNCHVQLEKFLLKVHLNKDCPKRKLKCQICDIEISANDISEHENYCGARTEKCSECGEYVMIKYKQLHIDSNHTFVKLSDEPGPSPSWQNGRRTLGNFIPDFESVTSKSQTHHKKKTGRTESKLRRGKGLLEYTGKDDEIVKESIGGETRDGNTFLENMNKVTTNSRESKGSSDSRTNRKTEKKILKKSLSGVAGVHSSDSTHTVNSNFDKDTKTRLEKGKGNSSRVDGGIVSEAVSRETSGNERKKKFAIDIDNDAAIAQAMEENAAVLSKFSLFEPLENNKSVPGRKLSENRYKGKASKTGRQSQLYEVDDSSDDEFLLYSKKAENDSDCDGLPCQFCGSLYSPYTLMSHQQMCDMNEDLDLYLRKKYDRKRFEEEEKEDIARYGSQELKLLLDRVGFNCELLSTTVSNSGIGSLQSFKRKMNL